MEKAKAFYTELLSDLGASLLMDMDRIAFIGTGMDAPMLSICVPYDESDPQPGNGNMVAITAPSKEKADELYHKAISMGASSEGEPGQRIPDMFYGAYIRDPDGNKLAFYVFG
jgi:predicted lactoylglutathione lyase